ncbi:MAG TPA: SMP-30/gluconolactonase/LRE family protein [Blastocatellia bacterium]|nr:SMP-30/gluconolactonase/LRE family protein [Blastocatellia bacterium]
MKTNPARLALIVSICIILTTFGHAQQAQENYPPGPDSKPQPDVPKGEVLKFTFDQSKIFSGTWREYWVYVPAQYTPDKPACLYVNQDGIQWQAPTVFDNLIHKKEMPVTIGVFVMHGRVKASDDNTALDRFNRSYEYDGLGDNYVRFLTEELLPEVETKKTSDGRPIRLSHNGNDRAIGGSSSGAICAFTAAWERPREFSRVFSAIGTYVGLRGGDRYHTLVRKFEPKPIRIYLQDGSNDLNIYAGDWWMANQTMERALTFAGYELNHVWGEGAHNGNHGTAIFPDAMRWLWKDWPQPVKVGQSKNNTLDAILVPGEGWHLVEEGLRSADGAAVNQKGEVYFNDALTNRSYIYGLGDNELTSAAKPNKRNRHAFGPDGRLYVLTEGGKRIVAYDAKGKMKVIAYGLNGKDMIVASNGNIYVTSPGAGGTETSKVWLIKPSGEKKIVDTGLSYANGVTLSPDQTLLYVDDSRSHWVYSYRIRPDGALQFKQRYYWLHVPDTSDVSGAEGMCVDRDGRLYVASEAGIQVCDQAGRVNCILAPPGGKVLSMSFGGANFDKLFVVSSEAVYERKLKVKGAQAWDVPLKPAAPRL